MFGGIVEPICFAAFGIEEHEVLSNHVRTFVVFVILVVSQCLRV
jgi:hypothetical protein